MKAPASWYPYRLRDDAGLAWCECLWLKDIPFTDPFFYETVLKGKSLPGNSGRFRSSLGLDGLAGWAKETGSIQPTAFIFHVSRCGSTLLSQLLGLNAERIVLSEVRFFDELLRLPFRNARFTAEQAQDYFQSALRIYGQKRTGEETQLFVKLDSWHLVHWKKLREAYPATPFVVIYRHPAEVLRSHRAAPGMQAVPGLLEPELFGFDRDRALSLHPDAYTAAVLDRFFELVLEMRAGDVPVTLINYAEGPLTLLQRTLEACGLPLSAGERQQAHERIAFHGKYPRQQFVKEAPIETVPPEVKDLAERYFELEDIRRQTPEPA